MNFTRERQPLVDAAFLAQGLLRAPRALARSLDAPTKRNLIAALESTRAISPGFNNWLLFSAMVEAGLDSARRARGIACASTTRCASTSSGTRATAPTATARRSTGTTTTASSSTRCWSTCSTACRDEIAGVEGDRRRDATSARARYAAVQERLIAPDGSFPPIGRSLAYRCGAFHLLAQAALRRALPDGVSPAQVRGALTAVIRRTLEAPGHVRRGRLAAHRLLRPSARRRRDLHLDRQLYLCAVAFLPLGLAAQDPFWSAPAQPWTSVKAWSGQAFPIDHAI